MSLLHMSFAGAVMILAVTVIRALVIYRVPKKTFMVLWGITPVSYTHLDVYKRQVQVNRYLRMKKKVRAVLFQIHWWCQKDL